jgi:hypothetical protein
VKNLQDFASEEEAYKYVSHVLSEKGYKVKRIMSGKGKQSPDADIELEKNNEKIAIEVKYFKDTPKFYLGLDEALALLLHGYDKVYLLHVLDTALSDKCENHVSKALAIINLTPIGYMFMIGRGDPKILREALRNPLKMDPHLHESHSQSIH